MKWNVCQEVKLLSAINNESLYTSFFCGSPKERGTYGGSGEGRLFFGFLSMQQPAPKSTVHADEALRCFSFFLKTWLY